MVGVCKYGDWCLTPNKRTNTIPPRIPETGKTLFQIRPSKTELMMNICSESFIYKTMYEIHVYSELDI